MHTTPTRCSSLPYLEKSWIPETKPPEKQRLPIYLKAPEGETCNEPSPLLKGRSASTIRRARSIPPGLKLSSIKLPNIHPFTTTGETKFIEKFLDSSPNITLFLSFSPLRLPTSIQDIDPSFISSFFSECDRITAYIWNFLPSDDKNRISNLFQDDHLEQKFITILLEGLKYQLPFLKHILASKQGRELFKNMTSVTLPEKSTIPASFHQTFFNLCEDILKRCKERDATLFFFSTKLQDERNLRCDPQAFINLLIAFVKEYGIF